MSRDTKTSCADCQGRVEVFFAPSTSHSRPTKRDGSNESKDREKSIRPATSPVPIASDTDEGDYETSSEGMIPLKRRDTEIRKTQTKESLCVYFKNKSASLSELVAFNKNVSLIKEGVILDSYEFAGNKLTREITVENKITRVHGSLVFVSENLAKSKSMPILRSEISSNSSANFKAMDIALISESSFAREKKMSMIVERMTPLISSTVFVTSDATTNFHSQKYGTRKVKSKTTPVFYDTTPPAVINGEKSEELAREVTLRKTRNNHRTMDWDRYRDPTIPTLVDLTNDSDFVDVARNSRSSIKSDYFSPDPSAPSDEKQQRAFTDVEVLMKIDNELSPLRYQFSEVIGKTRALGLKLGASFDLGISRRPRPEDGPKTFVDRDRKFPRLIDNLLENRSGLVDNTWPSPAFPVVGKLTSTGRSNGSNGRRKTSSLVIPDLSGSVGSSNDGLPRSGDRLGTSGSYLPTTGSRASRETNVRNELRSEVIERVINSRARRGSNAEVRGTVPTWDLGRRSVRQSVASSSNVHRGREYDSHRYLDRAIENTRTSGDDFHEVRKRESSVFIVIDDVWPVVDAEATSHESTNQHFEDPREVEFVDGVRRENIPSETERVVRTDRSSSPLESILIDRFIDRDPRVSLATPASKTGVNLNGTFCATVEKRFTSRAVSPVRNLLSSATSPNNMLFATSVSSIFMQQVRTDSRTEMVKVESPPEMRSAEINNGNDATRKRDFCVRRIDSRWRNAKEPTRLSDPERDPLDLTGRRERAQRHLRLSKEKITIVPIVIADGIARSSRIADVIDLADPRRIDEIIPRLNREFALFEAEKPRGTSSSEISRRNPASSVRLIDDVGPGKEKSRRPSVSRANQNSYIREDDAPSRVARGSTSRARVGGKTRDYSKSVARMIPGMRSSPEDFLCEET